MILSAIAGKDIEEEDDIDKQILVEAVLLQIKNASDIKD